MWFCREQLRCSIGAASLRSCSAPSRRSPRPVARRTSRDLSRPRPRRAGRDPDRPLGRAAHLRARARTTSSWRRAGTPRATGCGSSTCGSAAATARSPRRSVPSTSRRTARRGCCSTAATCATSGSPTPATPSASCPRSSPASTPTSRSPRQRPDLLPPEFRALDYRPARWTPETVVAIRSHGLLRNAKAELQARALPAPLRRARARAARPLRAAARARGPGGSRPRRLRRARRSPTTTWAPAPCRSPRCSTTSSRAATTPRATRPWRAATTGRSPRRARPPAGRSSPTIRTARSSCRRCATWCICRRRASRSIGAGEPALPGVSLGHNGHVAFGFTIFAMDQEDLYVLEHARARGEPPEYRVGGRLGAHDRGARARRGARRRRRTRGGAAIHPLRPRARRGSGARRRRSRCARRGSSREWRPISRASSCSAFATGTASSPRSTAGACRARTWSTPTPRAPSAGSRRAACRSAPGWDGLLPVPGDGRYQWAGYLDGDALPVESNPARGWVASANQMNLPPGYPHAIAYEWAPRYRYERIAEALSSARAMERRRRGAPPDRLRVAAGAVAGRAARRARSTAAATSSAARSLCCAIGTADSMPAAPPRRCSRSGCAGICRPRCGDGWRAARGSTPMPRGSSSRRRCRRSWRRSSAARSLPAEEKRAALLESLAAAAADVEERLGADWRAWRWGALHHSRFDHPLAAPLRAQARPRDRDRTVCRACGSGDTPGATTYEPPTSDSGRARACAS